MVYDIEGIRGVPLNDTAFIAECVIDNELESKLFEIYNTLAGCFGKEKQSFESFHEWYYDGYAGNIRSEVIALFEPIGLEIFRKER